jgi:SlyX protein
MSEIRIQALEEKTAELLKTTDELSDVVARQEREIAVLTHRVQMLMQREGERDSQVGGGIMLGDERPPHY